MIAPVILPFLKRTWTFSPSSFLASQAFTSFSVITSVRFSRSVTGAGAGVGATFPVKVANFWSNAACSCVVRATGLKGAGSKFDFHQMPAAAAATPASPSRTHRVITSGCRQNERFGSVGVREEERGGVCMAVVSMFAGRSYSIRTGKANSTFRGRLQPRLTLKALPR